MSSSKRIWFVALLGIIVIGCSKAHENKTSQINLTPTVKVQQPELREIRLPIAQPGKIEAFEQTAIYSKISGFVRKWHVDIGSHVKKGEPLVELMVPELADEHEKKMAEVEQSNANVQQFEKLVTVAQSNVQAAADAVVEAQANIKRFEADVERWQGELNRLTKLAKDGVVNPEVLAETDNQLKSSQAAIDAARAAVKTKDSQRVAAEAQVGKAKADLQASQAQVKVAKADEQRLAAMLQYTQITAPYDGVITSRVVSTGDFVRAGAGNPTEGGGSSSSAPMLVLTRTDPMVFEIGVPEVDAPYVSVGSKATLRLQALAGREFDLKVTRLAPTLDRQSRTLLAQVDLPNPDGQLMPGMYAYGSIELQRPHVRAIPSSAVVQIGNRICCYLLAADKAVRAEVQTGVSDGSWVEVQKRALYPTKGQVGAWQDFDGTEQVIVGDLSEIADGQKVAVNDTDRSHQIKLTSANVVHREARKIALP